MRTGGSAASRHPAPPVFPGHPPLSYCGTGAVPRRLSHSSCPGQGTGLSRGLPPLWLLAPPRWPTLHWRLLAHPGCPALSSSALGNDTCRLYIALQGLERGVHSVPLPGTLTEPSSHAHPLDHKRVGKAGWEFQEA